MLLVDDVLGGSSEFSEKNADVVFGWPHTPCASAIVRRSTVITFRRPSKVTPLPKLRGRRRRTTK